MQTTPAPPFPYKILSVCLLIFKCEINESAQFKNRYSKLNCEPELSWLLKAMLLKSVVSSSRRLSHSCTALPAACDSRMTVLNFCSILNEWCSYLNGSQFIQILEEDTGFILRKGPLFWAHFCETQLHEPGKKSRTACTTKVSKCRVSNGEKCCFRLSSPQARTTFNG